MNEDATAFTNGHDHTPDETAKIEDEGFNKFKRKNVKPRNSSKRKDTNEDNKYGKLIQYFQKIIQMFRNDESSKSLDENTKKEFNNINSISKEA